MIRRAQAEDFPTILDMCELFWRETDYNDEYDRDYTQIRVELAHEQGLLAVLDVDGVKGFLAGIRGPILVNPNVFTGTELAWWINPEHRKGGRGINLILFIEKMARCEGIKYWNMISMESSNPLASNKIYERLGYKKSETSWTKRL